MILTATYRLQVHGGFGFGLRLFSPIQDVIRVDVGFTEEGVIRPYFSTGTNF